MSEKNIYVLISHINNGTVTINTDATGVSANSFEEARQMVLTDDLKKRITILNDSASGLAFSVHQQEGAECTVVCVMKNEPLQINLIKHPVTFCLTSCGRLDLLTRTLESFFKLNKYPIEKFIINDDTGDQWRMAEISDAIRAIFHKYSKPVQILGTQEKRGQSASIDAMYALVETELIFHCEDDWLFEGNANFIEDSIKILEARKDIHQVWIRHGFDHGHPLKQMEQIEGIYCSELQKNFIQSWSGFTWNPGIRRMSDYKKMFPNGYHEFKNDGTGSEQACSIHANTFDYRAVALMDGSCRHIGANDHTKNYQW